MDSNILLYVGLETEGGIFIAKLSYPKDKWQLTGTANPTVPPALYPLAAAHY